MREKSNTTSENIKYANKTNIHHFTAEWLTPSLINGNVNGSIPI
jgi:hypothetical protein